MILKYSGKQVSFTRGVGELIEISGDIHKDEISIWHDSDCNGQFTHIMVNGSSIAVDTDSLKCETITKELTS